MKSPTTQYFQVPVFQILKLRLSDVCTDQLLPTFQMAVDKFSGVDVILAATGKPWEERDDVAHFVGHLTGQPRDQARGSPLLNPRVRAAEIALERWGDSDTAPSILLSGVGLFLCVSRVGLFQGVKRGEIFSPGRNYLRRLLMRCTVVGIGDCGLAQNGLGEIASNSRTGRQLRNVKASTQNLQGIFLIKSRFFVPTAIII